MEKRKKFHHALLKLYYPPPQPLEPQKFEASPAAEEEPLEVPYIDVSLDASPELEEGNDDCDLGSEKLTRAQRKRIRKRKLKEAASAGRRTIIGPLSPSGYEDHKDEHCKHPMQSFPKENCKIVKDARQNLCEQVSQL